MPTIIIYLLIAGFILSVFVFTILIRSIIRKSRDYSHCQNEVNSIVFKGEYNSTILTTFDIFKHHNKSYQQVNKKNGAKVTPITHWQQNFSENYKNNIAINGGY